MKIRDTTLLIMTTTKIYNTTTDSTTPHRLNINYFTSNIPTLPGSLIVVCLGWALQVVSR